MSPKPVDKEEKKAFIANCALKVFRQKGFSETTVEEIAFEAGIGKGTVYEYYKSKEEIVLKIFDDFFNSEEEKLETVKSIDTNAKEGIKKLLQSSFGRLEFYSEVIPVYFEFWSSSTGRALGLNKKMSGRFEKIAIQVYKYLQKGKKNGEFSRTIDSRALSAIFVSSMDGLILYYALYRPKKKIFSRQIKETENMFFKYIEREVL